MFARRASSSAVWKATSSRWSTTYCATSFCERENSSKRAEMYVESVWWPRAAGGMVAVLGMARRSFDGRSLTSSRQCNGLRLDSTASSCSHPPCTATNAASSWRRSAPMSRAEHGIPTEFVQDNHSRSRQGTLRGIHFQTHPGQGKLVRVARGRVFDVVVDLRRGSPTFGEWEGVELDDTSGAMLWIPVGFGHGFLVLSEVADFVYKCTNYYDPATEAGIRFDDPGRRHRVAVGGRAAVLAARRRRRRRWRRSRTRCRSRCEPDAASHPRRRASCTSATCAPRCWRGCSRARPGSGFVMRVEDLDAGRVRPEFVQEQLGDLAAIGLDWDGEVRRAVRAHARCTRRRWRGCRSTSASARGPRSARAASAAHGPVGRVSGHVPAAVRRRARGASAPPAASPRCACTPAPPRVDFVDRVLGPADGVVDDFVVRRNDGAFAYNLAVVVDDAAQGVEEVVRGADLVDSTPRQIWLARALGVPEPSYAHVPLVLGADGRRLAKRHGDVTLREVDPADARGVDGAARSGCARRRPRPSCSTGSTRDEIPREPTTSRRIDSAPRWSAARTSGPA